MFISTGLTIQLYLHFSPGDKVGNDFYLGIPLLPPSTQFELTIGTPNDEATYVVESAEGELDAGTTSSTDPATLILDTSRFGVANSGFFERKKGIRVQATGENSISVLVVVRYTVTPFFVNLIGYGSYPMYPNYEVDEPGGQYVYYAISSDYAGEPAITNRRSNILLVGNHDETAITITPSTDVSLPLDAQSNSPLVDVAAGTAHTVTLNSFQTLGISDLLDLTGTKIESDKALTIISGHQCAQVPIDRGFCEPLYVPIPPTFNWGQFFFLGPFEGRTASQQYKFVTSTDATTVAWRCGEINEGLDELAAGTGSLISLNSPIYCYLTANAPIFMVQIAPGNAVDGVGDTAMMALAPSSAHVTGATFLNFPNDFEQNFITVMVQDEYFVPNEIQLDDAILGCTWNDILNINDDTVVGHGCTFGVEAGPHVIMHMGGDSFLSVNAYGWNSVRNFGYAYLTNFQFSEVEIIEGTSI